MKRPILLAGWLALMLLAGCNGWERDTFNTLSASNALLTTAQKDYEANTIPETKCAYMVINDGKAAQTVAVNAMLVYEQLKASKGNLTAQEAVVTADLVALAPLVVQVQSLVSNPASQCGGKA